MGSALVEVRALVHPEQLVRSVQEAIDFGGLVLVVLGAKDAPQGHGVSDLMLCRRERCSPRSSDDSNVPAAVSDHEPSGERDWDRRGP